jgi:enoyl-CoA hydratase/carnithine racemase
MDAAEAKHWGLANHVVAKGEGIAKAEIAQQLATGHRVIPGHQAAASPMVPEHEAFELHDSRRRATVIRSDDLKEGAGFSESVNLAGLVAGPGHVAVQRR